MLCVMLVLLQVIGVVLGLGTSWASEQTPDFTQRCDRLLSEIKEGNALEAFEALAAPGASLVLGRFKTVQPVEEELNRKVALATKSEQSEILALIERKLGSKDANAYLLSVFLSLDMTNFYFHTDWAYRVRDRVQYAVMTASEDQETLRTMMEFHRAHFEKATIDLKTFQELLSARRMSYIRYWPTSLHEVDAALLRTDLRDPEIRGWIDQQIANDADAETIGVLRELMAAQRVQALQPLDQPFAHAADDSYLARSFAEAKKRYEAKWAKDRPSGESEAAGILAKLDAMLASDLEPTKVLTIEEVSDWLFYPHPEIREKTLQAVVKHKQVNMRVIFRMIQSLKSPWEMEKAQWLQEASAWPVLETAFYRNLAKDNLANPNFAELLRPLMLTRNGTAHRVRVVNETLERMKGMYPRDFIGW